LNIKRTKRKKGGRSPKKGDVSAAGRGGRGKKKKEIEENATTSERKLLGSGD